METIHSADRGRGHPLGTVLELTILLTTVLTTLLVAFAWPTANLEPRDLPVAVAGPAQATDTLAATLPDDAVRVTAIGSREEAVTAIENRQVYGAIVLSTEGAEVLIASAASPAVAQALTEVAGQMPARPGTVPRVTDVVPLPEDDPRGAVFASGAMPLVLGGIVAAGLLALRLRDRRHRVLGMLGVAAAAGLALVGVLQGWFGALGGSYWANAGVVALAVAAIGLTLTGLYNLGGLPGLGVGAATMLLLGNPLSGVTSAPELLPRGWGALGQLLPPGAAGSALRSTAFFDGAGAGTPLLVLAAWAVGGLVLTAIPVGGRARGAAARRAVRRAAARRTDPDLATAVEASPGR
jgi:hypothetical protein